MQTSIIDGKAIAQSLKDKVALEAASLCQKGVTPCLAVILVGENPASISYVTAKEKALESCKMKSMAYHLDSTTTETKLLNLIDTLNSNKDVHGILVQLPLPPQIDAQKVIMAIDPKKDVDGFSPLNVGNLLIGKKCFVPCTPKGIIEIFRAENITTDGANVVIIGRSGIVGKPLALLMASKEVNSTVTLCHTGTRNLPLITQRADIVIVATGKPHTLKRDMIREGAVVIDVGVNRIPDAQKKSGFHLEGDCDNVVGVASAVTPVPGGVGPLTIAALMQNTIQAAKEQNPSL